MALFSGRIQIPRRQSLKGSFLPLDQLTTYIVTGFFSISQKKIIEQPKYTLLHLHACTSK